MLLKAFVVQKWVLKKGSGERKATFLINQVDGVQNLWQISNWKVVYQQGNH